MRVHMKKIHVQLLLQKMECIKIKFRKSSEIIKSVQLKII